MLKTFSFKLIGGTVLSGGTLSESFGMNLPMGSQADLKKVVWSWRQTAVTPFSEFSTHYTPCSAGIILRLPKANIEAPNTSNPTNNDGQMDVNLASIETGELNFNDWHCDVTSLRQMDVVAHNYSGANDFEFDLFVSITIDIIDKFSRKA